MATSNVALKIKNKADVIGTHTAVSTGATLTMPALYCTFQATAADNGGTITSATILIEVSNDEASWITMGTLSVTTDGTTDGFAANASWKFVRSRATAFSETGSTPTVSVTIGV